MNEPHAEFECGKHGERLLNVLKGGAGWCLRCRLYVQSANHPMPKLSPEVQAKRDAALTSKRKKKTASRKRKAVKLPISKRSKPAKARAVKRKVSEIERK